MSLILDGSAGVTFPNSTVQASAGQVLQVVQSVFKTNTSTTGSTFVTSTIAASITPKFSTSKILVTINAFASILAANASCAMSIYKNGSALSASTLGQGYLLSAGGAAYVTINMNYLDSPATTSSTTYTLYFRNADSAGTVAVGSTNGDSTITLMEIAG